MKRSSKILAALLTALLLVGVFATAIFASDLTTPSAKNTTLTFSGVDGILNRRNENFTGDNYTITSVGGVVTGSSTNFGVVFSQNSTMVDFDGDGTKETKINYNRSSGAFATVSAGGNTYGRIYNTDATTTGSTQTISVTKGEVTKEFTVGTAGAYSSIRGSGDTDNVPGDYSYLTNDFLVTDFDFAADQYVYTDSEGKTHLTTDLSSIPEGTTYDISYSNAITFQVHNRCTGHWTSGNNVLAITKINGLWVIKNKSTNDYVPLSQEAGVWNHITFVYDIDNRVDYKDSTGATKTAEYKDYLALEDASKTIVKNYLINSKLHVYINGVKLSSYTLLASDASSVHAVGPTEIRTSVPESGYYSFAVDNLTMNFYKNGYDGEIATAFAGDNVPETIGNVSDMIYNYNYVTPVPNAEYAAAVTSYDGEEYKTTYYYTVVEALANLGENDILALADGVAMNFAPEFPFYMIRNTEKTLVTYKNGYSEIAVNGGFYVTDDNVTADQLVAEGTGVRNLRHANYNEYLTKTMQYCPGKSPYGSVSGNNHGEILFFSNQLVTSKSHGVIQSGVDATGKNGYIRFWHDRTDATRYYHTGSSGNDTGFDIYYDNTASGYLLNHKYVVWNLDVMSDKYMTYNSATSEYTFTNEVTDMLAYGPAFRLGNVTSQFVGGSTSNLINGDINFWFMYDSTAKQYYVKLGGTSEKIYLSKTAGEWNHLSMVIAIDNTVDCEDAEGNKIVCSYPEAKAKGYKITSYHLYNSKLYAYANGQLVAEKVLFNTANVNTVGKEWYTCKETKYGPYNSSGKYIGTGTHVKNGDEYVEATYGNYVYDEATETYKEVTTGGYVIVTTKTVEQLSLYRQRVSDGYGGADNWKKISYSVGFDNGSLVYYDNTYAGTLDALYRDANGKPVAADGRTLASIVGKDVVGDSDYKYSIPNAAGATVAIGNELFNVSKDYSFAEGALAEAFEGTTVTVKRGNVKDFVPNANFDVVYGADGVSVSLKSGVGFVAVPADNGINIRKSNIKINWFGNDGKSYGSSDAYVGILPSIIPDIDSYREEGNKFYYLEESGKWHNGSVDGALIEDLAALTEGEYNLYADMTVPVIDIDESLILFNLTVANKFEKYVYVPYITGGDFLYNEVTYLLGGSKPNNETLEGYASTIQDYPSAVAGAGAGSMWIEATINGYTSKQWVRMPSIPEYIEKVLEGNFDYYTKKLCVNMARYCDEIYDYTREYQIATSEDGKSSLLATSPYNVYCTGEYSQYLIDTTTSAFNTQIAQDAKSENLNRIIDYFDGATFYLANTGIPRLAFVPKTLAEGETLPKEIIGVYYTYNAFKGEDPNKVPLPMDVTGNQSNSANTGIYMNVNRNERIYFYANDLKITVYFKDGSSETGTYNLASYIKGIEANGATTTGTSVDVAKAMYAYSMAAIEYMTTDATTPAPSTPAN